MSVLDLQYNFSGLSLKDLLEARDAYHFHLLSKANVVGTAVGYYLIRKTDPWPTKSGESRLGHGKPKTPRTLDNSEVRDYSWPCVLAFVKKWAADEEFGPAGQYDPSQSLPKTLYMQDGRAVPVCTVEVGETRTHKVAEPVWGPRPSHPLGGGCPIIVERQGERRSATAGCLVTDGFTTYALTARHASGDVGTIVRSVLREGEDRIGVSSGVNLMRLPFSEVYPNYPGRRSFSALDVGLVTLDRLEDWTSNTYGLPALGPMADVHEGNLSLRLIDQPVLGYGAASGLIRGKLKALFYRHRSVGGFDYVADFMIAPGDGVETRPGDSGMVWHLDVTPRDQRVDVIPLAKRDLRPLAVEWGGQVLGDTSHSASYAVATSLSTVCRQLNVELVTDVGRGVSGYWGRTGHYSIAALAITAVRDPKLKALMETNSSILSFDLDAIEQSGFDASVGALSSDDKFVPLADVPDEIWKKLPKSSGGRTGGRDSSGGGGMTNGPEHPTHYADIDAKHPDQATNLRELCRTDPDTYLTIEAWQNYYKRLTEVAKAEGRPKEANQYSNKLKKGLLPFRLWQFFDTMVECLSRSDIVGFVTAAGIAAHYMGDASQPLHGSYLADGDKYRDGPRVDADGNAIPYGDGVHSAYETKMVSRFASTLLPEAVNELAAMNELRLCKSGAQVARATIELMHVVAEELPPQKILDVFEEAGGGSKVAMLKAMNDELAEPTTKVLAHGARYLALLWDSAWFQASSAGMQPASPAKLEPKDVRAKYIKKTFVPSLTLDEVGDVLKVATHSPPSGWHP
ncbi:S1/P1 Nuclease [Roseateles aquatilis]|nr:S1/P1 Nuclease [Roseateles aquatilis]